MAEVANAALRAPPATGSPRGIDVLVDGLAIRFTDGYAASVPVLKRALGLVREEGASDEVDLRWPWFARRVAAEIFADDAWHHLTVRSVELTRENGGLAVLPLALNHLAHVRCLEGDLDGASRLIDEADSIAAATGTAPLLFARVPLAGCRGDETVAESVFEAVRADPAGEGVLLTFSDHARAVLYNALGRYEAAVASGLSAANRNELLASVWSLPEVVEAAIRSDQAAVAHEALERLASHTAAAGTELALGIAARSSALLSDGAVAEGSYREAITRLARSRLSLELARGHLLYGEWLRRERRRTDARQQLRMAQEMFISMGARAFAARAARELLATGETARKRTDETRDDLTAQESQIAHLARNGLSNVEIGARLFISPRTVEYHLHKVFAKLGITSRTHLDRVLPGD
jgi:DNA-binding CsgD family transcriptional regulator